jgi:hypothetical protein
MGDIVEPLAKKRKAPCPQVPVWNGVGFKAAALVVKWFQLFGESDELDLQGCFQQLKIPYAKVWLVGPWQQIAEKGLAFGSSILGRQWDRSLNLPSEPINRFHNTIFLPVMPENNACSLAEKCGHNLQRSAVYLPTGKSPLRTIIAFRDGEIYCATLKGTFGQCHGIAPFVAASVLGVTRRVPVGAYIATRASAAS